MESSERKKDKRNSWLQLHVGTAGMGFIVYFWGRKKKDIQTVLVIQITKKTKTKTKNSISILFCC